MIDKEIIHPEYSMKISFDTKKYNDAKKFNLRSMMTDNLFEKGVIILIIFLIIIMCVLGHKRQEWLNANCKEIGEMSSSTGIGIGSSSNGPVVTPVFIPGKTGYQCNDGKTYWE